jgi:hypothetical protein
MSSPNGSSKGGNFALSGSIAPEFSSQARRTRHSLTASRLVPAEHSKVQRRQIRPHTRRGRFHRLALHLRLRACLALTGRARRAHRRWRALDLGAAWPRARWALAGILRTGGIINNYRLLFRYTALQHILRQIRRRRALSLQHVLAHVRTHLRRRNTALQHILAHIRNRRARHLTADCTLLRASHSLCLKALWQVGAHIAYYECADHKTHQECSNKSI